MIKEWRRRDAVVTAAMELDVAQRKMASLTVEPRPDVFASSRAASLRIEEAPFKSRAASDYCASLQEEFGPCCLSSTVPLQCGMPVCVRNALDAAVSPSELKDAKEAILDGVCQLPYSTHKMSETKQPVTVDRVTGGALEEFFLNRSMGVSGLSWLRSTGDSKKTIGTYASVGFASQGSTPDGVCWCGDQSGDQIPLTFLELKDTALDPFDAFGQALAAGAASAECRLVVGPMSRACHLQQRLQVSLWFRHTFGAALCSCWCYLIRAGRIISCCS